MVIKLIYVIITLILLMFDSLGEHSLKYVLNMFHMQIDCASFVDSKTITVIVIVIVDLI